MADTGLPECLTFPYQTIRGIQVELGLYLPPSRKPPFRSQRPVLVYFHGGGLTVGEKTSWFPFWLHSRTMAAGFAFISAEYRLLPPATGHDIIEDINALFRFIGDEINDLIGAGGRDDRLDADRIAVIGTSAGGLCAYLAGIHAKPKPVAILSMYGMGGNFFTPHYFTPKTTSFFRGRELLDPALFHEFLYPNTIMVSETSSSPLSYHGKEHAIPGYPSNPRMLLARLYLQLGSFIDYYTGQYEPSISERLRAYAEVEENKSSSWRLAVPSSCQHLFPQLNITAFPPTFFIHGSADTAVLAQESRTLHRELQSASIPTVLRICDGMEHSFDYHVDAEKRWGDVFDEAFQFLKDQLTSKGVPSQ